MVYVPVLSNSDVNFLHRVLDDKNQSRTVALKSQLKSKNTTGVTGYLNKNLTLDESLPTKQTVVFLNFNCDFDVTVPVLIKIFKEPINITNDSYIHTMSIISSKEHVARITEYIFISLTFRDTLIP